MASRRLDSAGAGLYDPPRPSRPPATPATPASTSSEQLLEALCLQIGRFDTFDPQQAAADLTSALVSSGELRDVLKQTTEHLLALEQLNLTETDDVEPPTVDGVRIVVPTLPRLADVCFAAVIELNRASAELSRAPTPEEAWAAQETALRKLRRAIRAVLESAEESGLRRFEAGEQLRQRCVADLTAALALRRLYADFRRALRRAEDDTPEAVLTALRYAAGALASLISSADYAHARVWDRAILRRLQQRLFAWAHGGKPNDRGLELLDDVWTSADLLRGINRRQELRLHDSALIQRLCAGPTSDPHPWLTQLPALLGLEDQLDTLIDRSRQAPTRPLIDELLLRLSALR
jgi:hypothetical protein